MRQMGFIHDGNYQYQGTKSRKRHVHYAVQVHRVLTSSCGISSFLDEVHWGGLFLLLLWLLVLFRFSPRRLIRVLFDKLLINVINQCYSLEINIIHHTRICNLLDKLFFSLKPCSSPVE